MLKQRVITAVILAAVVLWALYFWPLPGFAALLTLATFACAWEWSALGNLHTPWARVVFSGVVAAIAAVTMFFISPLLLKIELLVAVVCWMAIVFDLYKRPVVSVDSGAVRWQLLLLAGFILIVSVVTLYRLREVAGANFIVYVVALVAAADIGAYFCGRKFGKRKLAVQISKGKTIEGAIGGLLAALLLAAMAVVYFAGEQSSTVALFCLSIIAALFSIAGDLFISRAKRTRGVKDSGNLLPGHGGVLDRFDGLLAAIPFMGVAVFWF